MAIEQPGRDPFVAAIEKKIAAWQAVLDSYRAAVSLDGPLGGESTANHAPHHGPAVAHKPLDLPVGVFRDKTIREAIEIFLATGRRKQTNKEIAIGLQRGGIATTSSNFEATIATALGRMKDDGVVLRFPDGWDLASSYPESLRSRLREKAAKPKSQEKTVEQKPTSEAAPPSGLSEDKTALMLQLIEESPSGLSISDIIAALRARELRATRDYVRVVLKRLRQRAQIVEGEGGMYIAARPVEPAIENLA